MLSKNLRLMLRIKPSEKVFYFVLKNSNSEIISKIEGFVFFMGDLSIGKIKFSLKNTEKIKKR